MQLFAKSQFLDQLAVTLQVGMGKIGKQSFSFTDHLQQAPVGGEVLLVGLQMRGDAVYPLREQSDLRFDGTGVGNASAKILENIGLFFVS